MVSGLNFSSFGALRLFSIRVLSFGRNAVKGHFKILFLHSLQGLIAIGSTLSLVVALCSAYLYLFPSLHSSVIFDSDASISQCNVFEGRWINDETFPLYNASECPFAERGFDCLANGRKDAEYLNWRWKPKGCEIPKLVVHDVLENLRGKRIVFVGDSMSRTQWESMICMLMAGLEDKKSVYEVNGNKITKQIRFLGVRFKSHNLSIDFYRSVFLVQPGPAPRRVPKRVTTTLRLDKMDDISSEWIQSDVLVFNTGQWWTEGKLFEMGYYFQVGRSLKLGMSVKAAFQTALDTWASWVENTINTNETRVFFRSYEASHWRGEQNHRICKLSKHPLSNTKGKDRNPFSEIIINRVKKMKVPVTALHVTPMDAYRSDAHVGTYSDTPLVPDCSHWCLPGVPDMWNEILFTHLLSRDGAFR